MIDFEQASSFQYALLSGEIPFLNHGKNLCAAEIMSSIQKGEVKLEGDAWDKVSLEAKDLVRGDNCLLHFASDT